MRGGGAIAALSPRPDDSAARDYIESMASDFPALAELTRYVPDAGQRIAVTVEDGTVETLDVLRAHGSHVIVPLTAPVAPGTSLGLVWEMPEGRAWCDAQVVAADGGEVELALGTVSVREHRRARRRAPQHRVAAVVALPDGDEVHGRLLDVSVGGAALLVGDDAIRPGHVVHIRFTADDGRGVEADCVVMHAAPRDGATVVGLAIETAGTGLLALAGLED